MPEQLPLLSLLIWGPIVGGVWLLYVGDRQWETTKRLALMISTFVFLLSTLLYKNFNLDTSAMQFVEFTRWIEPLNVNYHLGVDGIAMPLIILNTFVTLLVVVSAWCAIETKISHYLAAFLIMEGLINGVFSAMDAILFYVFFEAMLIPMFLIIGIWGGPQRIYATIKFFLYTFLGSIMMLVALLYLYTRSASFTITDLYHLELTASAQKLVFIAFFLAFAVKIPMWPIHTWLPDAHVEAPTGGSVILAAILLKIGGYGFLRFSLPITPDASLYFDDVMIVLSLIAIVYIGFVALVQQDMKKLIAYSSISHMGFVTLGFFVGLSVYVATGTTQGAVLALSGGVMQMISHGFISAALFLCVGMMYERVHSRQIQDYGGVANTMPRFAALMMLFAMANAGLPGTSGFVGEFLVILGSYQANFWIAFFAALTLILGAAYTLWMYKRVVFGEVANDAVATLKDIDHREFLILSLLAIAVLWFGFYPKPLFDAMHPTLVHLFDHVVQSSVGNAPGG